jgi:hypothetical protein
MGTRFPIILLALLTAGCSDPAPAQFAGSPDDAIQPLPGQVPGAIPPGERVPAYLPAVPGLPAPSSPPIPPPLAPAPNFAPGLPSGPVTGYGAGGMQAPPGAPPNPPYPAGGLMH